MFKLHFGLQSRLQRFSRLQGGGGGQKKAVLEKHSSTLCQQATCVLAEPQLHIQAENTRQCQKLHVCQSTSGLMGNKQNSHLPRRRWATGARLLPTFHPYLKVPREATRISHAMFLTQHICLEFQSHTDFLQKLPQCSKGASWDSLKTWHWLVMYIRKLCCHHFKVRT